MSEVEPVPTDRKGIIPHLTVSNGEAALKYYAEAFGAEILHTVPIEDGRLIHAEFKIGDTVFYMNDDFPEMTDGKCITPEALGGSSVTIHQYVADVDAALAKAEAAGGKITIPADDMFWGDRYGQVTDPFGQTWSFATHIKDPTEEELEAARNMF